MQSTPQGGRKGRQTFHSESVSQPRQEGWIGLGSHGMRPLEKSSWLTGVCLQGPLGAFSSGDSTLWSRLALSGCFNVFGLSCCASWSPLILPLCFVTQEKGTWVLGLKASSWWGIAEGWSPGTIAAWWLVGVGEPVEGGVLLWVGGSLVPAGLPSRGSACGSWGCPCSVRCPSLSSPSAP